MSGRMLEERRPRARQLLEVFAALALVLLIAASAPAYPQAEQVAGSGDAQGQDKGEAVERILQQQEAMIRGQRFSYDPDGRRDPFRSLFDNVRDDKRPRPPGVQGMLVTEIDLAGIVRDSRDGNIAYFTGSDNKGYFLRVGDLVYDGTLIAIDSLKGAVTFRQQVDDPRRIKPYIDVVKALAPLEEGSGNE